MKLQAHPHRQDQFRRALEQVMAEPLSTAVRYALIELNRGGLSLAEVEARMDPEDPGIVALYFAIERLESFGLLCRTIVDRRGEPLVTIEPLGHEAHYEPNDVRDDAIVVLSPYAFLRRDLDQVVVEVPTGRARARFRDPACLLLLAELASPIRLTALLCRLPKRIRAVARELVGALMHCEVAETTEHASSRRFRRECWEFHDLLFHARSREGWVGAVYGGSYRFRGYSRPSATLKDVPEGERVPLPAAREPAARDFWEVLERRRSHRQAVERLELEDLAALLWHAARIRGVEATPNGYSTTRRAYPSGGACHPLEIYVVANRCGQLTSGLYYYDANAHALVRVALDIAGLAADAGRAAGLDAAPDAVLVMTARFRRMAWKYEGVAYALVLKEVGALMQTLALTATALGIGACPLGNGNGVNFCTLAGVDYAEESPVGELLIVGKASHASA